MGDSDLEGGRRERLEDGWNAPWLQLAVTISKVAFDSCSIYFSEEKEDEMTEEGRVVEPYEEVQGCVTEGGRDNVYRIRATWRWRL